jgi:hypothetical protein
MTMTTATTAATRRSIVALKLPKPVPALISVAKGIVQSMTSNTSFPNPVPPLATVTAAINDLETAETAAQSKTRGAATVRDGKRATLITMLDQLKSSVQQVADANRETAPALIQSGGMSVKGPAVHPPRVFAAKQGAVSGSVKLTAQSAARRASYEWESSVDGGKTWVLAPSTLQAKTTLSGLVPGSSYSFRYRPVTKTGEADWSQPIALIVK